MVKQLLKYENGVMTFPYAITQLYQDNPNTSFPRPITEEILGRHNVFFAEEAERPSVNASTQYLTRNDPTQDADGNWQITFSVQTRNASEQETYDASISIMQRKKRNDLLSESDWTQISDNALSAEVKASWATYRTNLRNLPDHANWPHLEDTDWPTKPS